LLALLAHSDHDTALVAATPSLTCMRAVQITRFGGLEVVDVVDLPDPVPGDGQRLHDVSTAGLNFADTHPRACLERYISNRRRPLRCRRTAALIARSPGQPARHVAQNGAVTRPAA
jgi:hypothetical protein